MPFHRRSRMSPITAQKHEITWSNIGQDAGTAGITVDLVQASEIGSVSFATPDLCPIGSHVKSIYLEFHFSAAQTGNLNVIHWKIGKEPFGTNLTNANTYTQIDQRFILKRGMEMLPASVSTVFKRVFVVRIPPRIAKISAGDKIVFMYQASSTQTINACGFAIYRNFY